jgi:hypothetical protein
MRFFKLTQSKDSSLFIRNNLLWRANLNQRVPLLKIDGVEAANLVEMHNVPEIPAYDHVHTLDRCDGNMVASLREAWPRTFAST